MTTPSKIMKEYGYFPKKEFGQNFLVDPSTPEMIIKKAEIEKGSNIIEIGSGLGALTKAASRHGDFVFGIEKDKRLIPILEKELEKDLCSNVKIINQDILKTDIGSLLSTEKKNYLIGNLPYNISSQIIFQALEQSHKIEKCVFMLQKELAQRIAAPKGTKDYGRISVILKYYADLKIIAGLKPSLFYPRPKVDSSVIVIEFKKEQTNKVKDEKTFHEIVKLSFGQRRKTLKNSLGKGIKDKALLQNIFESLDLSLSSRGEDLELEDYINISNKLSENNVNPC
ncbi:MAG: 16S rRNA (adenine(1518)-N(6)/adenine(1519)-N(6))-dimethyltransferase RsmA [Desulforegulaceae bacterium]|nr:16S rRNA (adenine(1518)-N(6)/adenine(1519)-N(6))-dimethyltransferase RsmA [Desulforegulaceae bacterium]